MNKKYILFAILLLIVIIAPFIIYQVQSIKRTYKSAAFKVRDYKDYTGIKACRLR